MYLNKQPASEPLEGVASTVGVTAAMWAPRAMWAYGYIAKKPRVQKVGMIVSIVMFAGAFVVGATRAAK